MKKARVADMAGRHCAKLSKGYRQRVGLAQAIIHNPDVLILDEPTAGLDPKQRVETRELIRELGGNHTIVLSSHILSEIADSCQRVVIINKGKVVAVDTPANLTLRLKGSDTMYLQVVGARRRSAGGARRASAGVDARRRHAKGRRHGRSRSRQRAEPRHPPRAGGDGRRASAGDCSNCGRCEWAWRTSI